MAKYAINGFGRIGRNVLRAMSKEERNKVVAINDLTPIETIAHLLKYDSTQGKFDGEISIEGDYLVVDGHKILITVERDPANLPWKDLGVDVVLESTGLFTKRDAAKKHLDAGAKKVLISAPPGSGPDFRSGHQRQRIRSCQARHRFQRFLHHQLPCSDGEGAGRQVRR